MCTCLDTFRDREYEVPAVIRVRNLIMDHSFIIGGIQCNLYSIKPFTEKLPGKD